MKFCPLTLPAVLFTAGLPFLVVHAGNPLIMDRFTADPTARVFEDRVFLYPSHDIRAPEGRGLREDWFCMEDYRVYSSEDLMNWTDHGVILTQEQVPWVDSTQYAMWAPDCVKRNGKYYFYFPAKDRSDRFGIGVAVADGPAGPFVAEDEPIAGVSGIDPCVLIRDNGEAYLYTSQNSISVAKLKDNMIEIENPPRRIENLPQQGLIEGPFVFERNGLIYLTYPHVANETERLEYAIGTDPMGPFEHQGVIMDENPSGCWTIHHSIIEYKGQWYLFYHDQQLSPEFDKNRSARADRLFFNADGTIRKVEPTLRGIGTQDAKQEIQIDRYSEVGGDHIPVEFLDDSDPHQGWKITLNAPADRVRFDRVDFGRGELTSMKVRAVSPAGGRLELRLDRRDGPLIARVDIAEGSEWNTFSTDMDSAPDGRHDLFLSLEEGAEVSIDWIRFE